MSIKFAHLREQGIDFLVFEADSTCRTASGRGEVLADLTARARLAGHRASKSALAFSEYGRLKYYGTPDLVAFLSRAGLPRWTHVLTA